jgi:hypothetical protein
MPLYFFKASNGRHKVEDKRGSQFDDDLVALQEVLLTVRNTFGGDPVSLIVTDDLGREVLRPGDPLVSE